MMVDKLSDFLIISIEVNDETNLASEEFLKKNLPDGWHCFINDIITSSRLLDVRLISVSIKNGVLYLKGDPTSTNIKLFERLVKAFCVESTQTCMMCGKVVHKCRRTLEVNKPVLCFKDYINYLNYLDFEKNKSEE